MARPYRLLLFDCFNTIFLAQAARTPTLLLEGRPVPSTAPLLHARLAATHPHLAVEELHRAQRAAALWARNERGPELREVSPLARFRHMLGLLGLDDPGERAVADLHEVHIQAVVNSFELPPEHRGLLEEWGQGYRLALFSNFDYAPAVIGLLQATGIKDWFDPLVISDQLGYRKPGRVAFERTLRLTGLPTEQILFVGDSLDEDVTGARAVGLDVAWVNPDGAAPPPGAPEPTYAIRHLRELRGLLA